MVKPLILIGGGGHCKSVINAAESSGLKIKGVIDLPDFLGSECLGHKVIGNDLDIIKYAKDCDFVVTLGFIKNPILRIRLHEIVEQCGGRFATVVASTANVSRHAIVKEGSVILHHANINAGACIGKGCIVNTCANIEHDAIIGNYCHISTGAMINGDCKVSERTFIGSGAILANGVNITADCRIGAGSVVMNDITLPGTYIGIPANIIKT